MSSISSGATGACSLNTSTSNEMNASYKAVLSVPLPTADGAHVIMQAIQVDEALPGTSRRFYQLPESRNVLCAKITATNPRSLRMAVHSIQEQIDLACRTLEAFGSTAVGGGVAPGSERRDRSRLLPSPGLKPSATRGLPPPPSGISL